MVVSVTPSAGVEMLDAVAQVGIVVSVYPTVMVDADDAVIHAGTITSVHDVTTPADAVLVASVVQSGIIDCVHVSPVPGVAA